MNQIDQQQGLQYRAFISYSHRDKATASWLHKTLENYRLPKKLLGMQTSVGKVPKRLTPIFRDQDELPASGNLGLELQNALANSLFLIVICSPSSAQSKWVNEEIRQFKAMHGSDRVLALIVDGEPNAKQLENECFAPALKFNVSADGELSPEKAEPIAADFRKAADGKRLAVLKLISGLTGLKLDDVVQRETARRMRTLVQISALSFLAAIFAVGLALYANQQRMDANAQREIAQQEAATAKAVSDFLVDSFKSATSLQENPNQITARSILDRGSEKIKTDLQDQPMVQSRLAYTIALAFNNLGLFDDAISVVDNTYSISGLQAPLPLIAKAEALFRKGELDASMDVIQRIQDILSINQTAQTDRSDGKIRYDIAGIKALIFYKRGELVDSLKSFELALNELNSLPNVSNVEIATVLQNRALLFSDLGEFDNANNDLEQAKELILQSVGIKDILFGQILLAQAQVSFLSWNLESALEQINMALANIQVILEGNNPILADALSMKGQILLETGDLEGAEIALTEAVNIYNNAFNGRHYLSGIAEVYLGLIAGDRKDLQASLEHFQEAKLHYDESYGRIHANHGDLLVNQATVLASLGELNRAKQDCEDGMIILNETLGKDAAFTQQLQAVCDELYTL